MTQGLVRYQQTGDLHHVTFSCYERRPYLRSPQARDLFEHALERMRVRYDFWINAYVVMPEHVHMLVSEPKKALLATAIQAVKLSVVRRSKERPFWQDRYYDFNVFSSEKFDEKVHYIHENPVRRGLVKDAEEWEWSSARNWRSGAAGVVEVESPWTAARRERARSEALK